MLSQKFTSVPGEWLTNYAARGSRGKTTLRFSKNGFFLIALTTMTFMLHSLEWWMAGILLLVPYCAT